MVTITNKEITPDGEYAVLTLSTGEVISIAVAWAGEYVQEPYTIIETIDGEEQEVTHYRDTNITHFQYEVEQATIRAQARLDAKESNTATALSILGL